MQNCLVIGILVILGCIATSDTSAQWGPEVDVSSGIMFNIVDEHSPRLAVSGRRVVGAWSFSDTNWRTIWKHSTDGGHSWTSGGALRPLDNNREGIGSLASVSVDGDSSFFVATYLGKSLEDGGETFAIFHGIPEDDSLKWSGPDLVMPYLRAPPGISWTLEMPALACDQGNDNLYLAYTHRKVDPIIHSRSAEIYFMKSTDGTWGSPELASGQTAEGSRLLLDNEGGLLLFWYDMAGPRMVLRKSLDQGVTFSEEITVSDVLPNFSIPPADYEIEGRPNGASCQPEWAPTFASIAIDRSQGPRRGWIYAVWNAPSARWSRLR